MLVKENLKISESGLELLSDPLVYQILSVIAEPLGVTPEEYLLRFEEALLRNPEDILGIFEN